MIVYAISIYDDIRCAKSFTLLNYLIISQQDACDASVTEISSWKENIFVVDCLNKRAWNGKQQNT